MSGGVDSSVAAYILTAQGYEVIGITMQIWQEVEFQTGACCSLEAVMDARQVAWKLGIPHYVFNFRDEFKSRVIDYFCSEYLNGRTPNPCIACNRFLKFESLLNRALGMDADYIATGHYARIERDAVSGLFRLYSGIDKTKDQSYALYTLNQHQLAHTLCPLGTYTKQEVRKLAEQAEIPTFDKPESQDLCFVSSGTYGDYVDRRIESRTETGLFRSTATGESLGLHRGIHHYTVGQRKGLGLALGHPAYVVDIDAQTGTVWVGEDAELFRPNLIAEDVSYIAGIPITGPTRLTARIRYSAPRTPALVTPLAEDRIRVDFDVPQRAITPGQAVVLCDGDQVVGGGTICSGHTSRL